MISVWDRDLYQGAFSSLRVGFNDPPVIFHYTLANEQAESESLFFSCRKKGIKNSRQIITRDATSRIFDLQMDLTAVTTIF